MILDKCKILLVEDEDNLRTLLLMELEQENFIVEEAANGEEGLKKAKTFMPDLIVCDVMMPVMDGFTMQEKLNEDEKLRDIPLIFLTAKSDKKDIRYGKSIGAEDYITKPFEFEDLLVSIKAKLKKSIERKERVKSRLDEIRKSILYAIPHEFKNPLSTLEGFLSLLLDKNYEASEKEKDEFLTYIKKSSDRLHHLVMKFLKLAELEVIEIDEKKLEALRKTRNINWHIEVNTIIEDLSEKFNVTIHSNLVGVDYPCPLDYNSLNTIILELINNAYKFSPPDRIDISFSAKATEKNFEITVEDKGIGLPKEAIDRVIEPFYQYNREHFEQQGSGLGLAIVNKIVTIYKGSIKIDSELNKGTRITLKFNIISEN